MVSHFWEVHSQSRGAYDCYNVLHVLEFVDTNGLTSGKTVSFWILVGCDSNSYLHTDFSESKLLISEE